MQIGEKIIPKEATWKRKAYGNLINHLMFLNGNNLDDRNEIKTWNDAAQKFGYEKAHPAITASSVNTPDVKLVSSTLYGSTTASSDSSFYGVSNNFNINNNYANFGASMNNNYNISSQAMNGNANGSNFVQSQQMWIEEYAQNSSNWFL